MIGRKKIGDDIAENDTGDAVETKPVSERDAEFARICGLQSEVERQEALLAFHAKYPAGES